MSFDYNLLHIFVLKHSSIDENIKTTAIIEDNAKQEDKEKQKQEPTTISIPRTKVNYNNESTAIQLTTVS
jgi:hypothetical protein